MRAWVLADSQTGYSWNFEVYTGKEDDADSGSRLGERVVLELTRDLWDKGYYAYFDNFYTSPSLCNKLLEHGTGSCGTVRINRIGIPENFQKAKLKKGEIKVFRKGKLTGVKWMDK